LRKILEIIIGIFIGLIVAGLLYLTVRTPAGKPVELLPSPTPEPIIVYVTGAVQRPGVYKIPRDGRLVDAIQQAGGFQEGADLTQVNLAEKVDDGAQIVIPGATGVPTPQLIIGGGGILVTPTPPAGQLVNINTANVELLDQLPGIGPTVAQKIVDYREENGSFASVNDLLKIPGIGPSTLDEIRGLVTIGP
jgi:competence protein ComEA